MRRSNPVSKAGSFLRARLSLAMPTPIRPTLLRALARSRVVRNRARPFGARLDKTSDAVPRMPASRISAPGLATVRAPLPRAARLPSRMLRNIPVRATALIWAAASMAATTNRASAAYGR